MDTSTCLAATTRDSGCICLQLRSSNLIRPALTSQTSTTTQEVLAISTAQCGSRGHALAAEAVPEHDVAPRQREPCPLPVPLHAASSRTVTRLPPAARRALQSWRHCCFAQASSADSAHLHVKPDPAHCRNHVRCPGTAHRHILEILQHIHLLEETVANMISDGWQGKP